MNNYAIFGVMAGIALLTTTIVSVLPVQRALAICANDGHNLACANDPSTGGGALAFAPQQGATANTHAPPHTSLGVGHACALSLLHHPIVLICVP
jgi:hypothetical protein